MVRPSASGRASSIVAAQIQVVNHAVGAQKALPHDKMADNVHEVVLADLKKEIG